MDLSKAYDGLPYDLLIAKLAAYGFDNSVLALITDYLTKHLQRIKIGSNFSSYLEILRGIPQGSISGPMSCNLFIYDLMFLIKETEICTFVDDITIYSCSLDYEGAHRKLSNDARIVLN